jgi:hypothetical protein
MADPGQPFDKLTPEEQEKAIVAQIEKTRKTGEQMAPVEIREQKTLEPFLAGTFKRRGIEEAYKILEKENIHSVIKKMAMTLHHNSSNRDAYSTVLQRGPEAVPKRDSAGYNSVYAISEAAGKLPDAIASPYILEFAQRCEAVSLYEKALPSEIATRLYNKWCEENTGAGGVHYQGSDRGGQGESRA